MQRLIDAEAFKQQLQISDGFQIDMYGNILTNVNVLNIALERSAIEAEPVKHGKWIPDNLDGGGYWVCTCCKHPTEAFAADRIYKYCPNCGARMDEERRRKKNESLR